MAKEEVQAALSQSGVEKFLFNTEEFIDNQIIYTPEAATTAIEASIKAFLIPKYQLDMLTMTKKHGK